MGFHATQGNGQTGHDSVRLRWSPRVSQPSMPVTVEEFEPLTDEAPQLAPNYARGANAGRAGGQTILGVHLTDGVAFRKVSASREELRVQGGKLVLRKVTRKDRAAWVGEYVATGQAHGQVLVMIPVIKGEPPVKGDARDLLLVRAVLSDHSIY